MRPTRLIPVALALAAVVGLALSFLREDPHGPARSIAPPEDSATAVGAGTEVPIAPVTAARDAADESRPAPSPLPDRAPRVLLTGTVQGMRPTPGGLRLTLRLGLPARVVHERIIDGDGAFELDLSEALQGAATKELMSLGLEGPGHLPSFVEPELRDDAGRAGDIVYGAELVARPIQRTLRGRLVDEAGEPLTGNAFLEFVAEPAAPDADTRPMIARPDRNGGFELAIASDDAGKLSAIAWGFRARARDVRSDELGTIDLGDWALSRGALVSGTASLRDATLPEGSVVLARAMSAQASDFQRFRYLQTRDGVLHHELVAAPIGPDGAFAVAGLEPGFSYGLAVVPAHVEGRIVVLLSSRTFDRTVTAPADGVTLDSDLALVLVEVVSEGAPVRMATLTAAEGDDEPERGMSEAPMAHREARTNSSGEAVVLVAPDRPTRIRVAAAGLRAVEVAVEPSTLELGPAGLRGPVRVELAREAAAGTLAWHVGDAHGAMQLEAQATCSLSGGEPVLLGPVPLTQGVATFTGVPVGEWTAILTLEFPRTLALEALPDAVPTRPRELVTIRANEVTEVRKALAQGGRLVLTFEGLEPLRSPLELQVTDAAGNYVLEPLYTAEGLGHVSRRRITTPGPYLVDRALPPGEYTLRFQGRGYVTATHTARVEVGRSTSLTVRLEHTEE